MRYKESKKSNQVVKGCELAMNSAIILAHENSAYHAENEKKK